MNWRIRESGHGGYVAERGCGIKNTTAPSGIGNIMRGFMVYESHHFETMKQAERFVNRQR